MSIVVRSAFLVFLLAGMLGASVSPAAATFRMATGTYVGGGSGSLSITNVGFSPDYVMIKGDGQLATVVRTSTMPADAAIRITYFSGLVSGRITSLDADGFTVGSDNDVNRAGTRYYWTAFMTGAGTMEVGTYTGSGVDTTITVSFQPDYVIVMGEVPETPTERFRDQPFDASDDFWGTTISGAIVDFVPTGFLVGTHLSVNDPGSTYHYAAWKSMAGQMAVGTYAGDGNAGVNITGPGFQPKFVSIGGGGNTTNAVFRTDSLLSDQSFRYRTGTLRANSIQAFLPNGFQIGSDRDVNWPGETYHWVAFAPLDTVDLALTKSVDNATP
ncbi:MAG: hypothetical protein OEN01_06695, partial [Candidatus Krumholzibacteria bacterium]|nr:hypothetical protein [Candidatus Krumholzibacteria bacterium]